MSNLTKTRTVLHRANNWYNGPNKPTFLADNEDDPSRQTVIVLDNDVYAEMGRPGTITVTIEPGDLLNEVPLGGEPGTTERAFNEAEGDRSE